MHFPNVDKLKQKHFPYVHPRSPHSQFGQNLSLVAWLSLTSADVNLMWEDNLNSSVSNVFCLVLIRVFE